MLFTHVCALKLYGMVDIEGDDVDGGWYDVELKIRRDL